ncbi:hypothetical protein, partial [Nocardia abscessus]|uniref:hypothetical protein n=1 Tax=Nocardia abscessus TaxID=120957 RepID=UPI002454ABD0
MRALPVTHDGETPIARLRTSRAQRTPTTSFERSETEHAPWGGPGGGGGGGGGGPARGGARRGGGRGGAGGGGRRPPPRRGGKVME